MSLFSEASAKFCVLNIGDQIETEGFLKACNEILPVIGKLQDDTNLV